MNRTQKTLTCFLTGLAGLSLSVFSAQAIPEPSQITQRVGQIPNYCQAKESLLVIAETRGFWVNICGRDVPQTYIGVSKQNGNKIRLPLKDYDQQGDYFEAVNGNVSYLLIRRTAKGDFLTVTQGKKELFRQPVLNWFEQ